MRFLLLSCLMIFAFEVDASSKRGGGKRGGDTSAVVVPAVVSEEARRIDGDRAPGVLPEALTGGTATSSAAAYAALPNKVFNVVRAKSENGFVLEKQAHAPGNTVTRILSLDTGDSNGLGTALILAVLEEILKHPSNQRTEVTAHSVKDAFHVLSATSMGNLIAAFLIHKDRSKTPLEILQFFYKSLSSSVFNTDHLRNNLLKTFGTSPVKDAFSHTVYLWASASERGFCFTNKTFVDPLGKQMNVKPENTAAPDALRSAIARGSISPSEIASNAGGHVEVKDGTPHADAQAFSSHQHLSVTGPVEVYSIGLGHNMTARTEAARRNEEAALDHLLRDLLSPTSPLCYFGRIQPVLVNSVVYDSTDPHTQRNCIEAALKSVRSDAFRDMVRQLGLVYPEADMDGICGKVCAGMKALSSKNRERLHESEVDWLIRQIKAFDYETLIQGKIYCVEGTEARLMTSAEYDALMGSIAQAEREKYGTRIIEEILAITKKLRDPCQALQKIEFRAWDLLGRMNLLQIEDRFKCLEHDKWSAYWKSIKQSLNSCAESLADVVAPLQSSGAAKTKEEEDAMSAAPEKSSRNLGTQVTQVTVDDDEDDFAEFLTPKTPGELGVGVEGMWLEIDANDFFSSFMQDYLKFLDANEFKAYNTEGIDKAAMLYIRARFGNEPFINHLGLTKLSSSVESVIGAIIKARNPGLLPNLFTEWFDKLFSATRYSSLHKALDAYIGAFFVQSVVEGDD